MSDNKKQWYSVTQKNSVNPTDKILVYDGSVSRTIEASLLKGADNLTNKSVIPFFAMERLPYLEQDLTESIYKLNHKKKTLGILSSIPIIGKQRDDHITLNTWEIINKIGDFYDIKIIIIKYH